ncbi:hypothetical protein KIN20_001171, partial [Parelaphostrongylus tenuis]
AHSLFGYSNVVSCSHRNFKKPRHIDFWEKMRRKQLLPPTRSVQPSRLALKILVEVKIKVKIKKRKPS